MNSKVVRSPQKPQNHRNKDDVSYTPRPVQMVRPRPTYGQYNSANRKSANNSGARFTGKKVPKNQ